MTDDRPVADGAGAAEVDGAGAAEVDSAGAAEADGAGAAEVLDCRGQRCPIPVIRLARRLPDLPIGSVLRVLADDPAAGNDIPAWCRLCQQEYVGTPAPGSYDVRRVR